jgi:hypothetical protein
MLVSNVVRCVDIVSETIKDFNWVKKTNTNEKLIDKFFAIAGNYGFTKEMLLEKSMEEAKTLNNYEFIEEPPHNIIEYNGTDFIIDVDNSKRVWVIFRRKLKKNMIDNNVKELINYFGAVYVYLGKKLDLCIDIFPDNIVHIVYNNSYGRNITYITTKYPRYLRGYINYSYNIINNNPFTKMSGEYIEYIKTSAKNIENMPISTKYIELFLSFDKNFDLSYLHCGIKKLVLNGGRFTHSFNYLPPTIEEIYIERLFTQLNCLPNNLKKLFITIAIKEISYCNITAKDYSNIIDHNFECISITDCIECDNGKIYNYIYKYNNTQFPEGFEELIISICDSYHILDSITELPSSFKKLVLTNYEHYISLEHYEQNTLYSLANEFINITKVIDNFINRFPNVIIEKINKSPRI